VEICIKASESSKVTSISTKTAHACTEDCKKDCENKMASKKECKEDCKMACCATEGTK